MMRRIATQQALRIIVAALGLLATAWAADVGGARSPSTTAIVGVNVVPMTDAATVLRNRTVLVRGDRILAVGQRGEIRVPTGATRIDGKGHYLLPGLADMHVHLEHLEDPDILKLFLAYGVTTVRNMDGRPFVLDWRNRAAEGTLTGPRIVTAGPVIDGDPPLREDNLAVPNAAAAQVAVRAQHRAGYDFIKVYTNLSPEAFRAAAAVARGLGMQVAGHVPRRLGLEEAIGALDAVEHLTDYGDALDARPAEEAQRWHWSKLLLAQPLDQEKVSALGAELARTSTWAVPTLIEAERRLGRDEQLEAWRDLPEMVAIPAPAREFWLDQVRRSSGRLDAEDWALVERGRRNRLSLVAALHKAGAGLLAGTDTPNPFVVPGASIHDELRLLVEAGLSPGAALLTATRDAARFLREEKEWGTVQVGRRADLILVRANPLERIGNSRSIEGVMAGGRWFGRAELSSMARSLD